MLNRLTRQRLAAATLLLLAAMATTGSASEVVAAEEKLEYRWRLSGFKGVVARLFVPGTGEGKLETTRASSGNLISELHISSSSAREGEYWLYGAEIDDRNRRTVRAWSSRRFRGESKERESKLEREEVIDLASSIFFLRRELPAEESRAQIWSNGRIYEVTVKPTGRSARLIDGRAVRTRSYSLRGSGEPLWRGRFDLVLAEDETATPLEIIVARDGLRVRLMLIEAEP